MEEVKPIQYTIFCFLNMAAQGNNLFLSVWESLLALIIEWGNPADLANLQLLTIFI